MTVLVVLLIANAIYNIIVWPQFYRRVTKDPRSRDEQGKATRFLTVHIVLVAIALTLALASLIAAIAAITGAL